MPENLKNTISALLLDWAKAKDEWNNDKIDEDFTALLKTREIVARAIEPLRSCEPKIVGSSLEVDIEISSTDKTKQELINKYSNVLSDLYIVSHVNIKTEEKPLNEFEKDDYLVKVFKATGEKCSRCWKYRKLNEDGICEDCKNAI